MSNIRDEASAAWDRVKTDHATVERHYTDARPGEITGYDERGKKLESRTRLSFDSKTLDLVTDPKRAQRVSPRDIQMASIGYGQLAMISRRIAKGDRTLGLDSGGEAQLSKALAGKYADDPARLWRVGSHSPAFLRTLSKAAATADIGMDALSSVFIASELTLMLPELVEVEKRLPSMRDFFPVKFLNTPGAKDYEFRTLDKRGRAVHTATFEGKAPRGIMSSSAIRRPLIWAWSGIEFSWLDLEEMKMARSAGSPLPDLVSTQTQVARESLLDLENLDVFFGSGTGDAKILGLLSQTAANTSAQGIPQGTAIANLADAATPEAAVQQLLIGVKAIYNERYRGDVVIALGTRDFVYIGSNTYGSADTEGPSIYDVALKRGAPFGLKAIVELPELGYEAEVGTYLASIGYKAPLTTTYAGGIGGKAVMLTAIKNPEYHRAIVGQDLMQLPPDIASGVTSIPFISSNGGLEVKQPKSMHLQIFNDPS